MRAASWFWTRWTNLIGLALTARRPSDTSIYLARADLVKAYALRAYERE